MILWRFKVTASNISGTAVSLNIFVREKSKLYK
jgi:hypothetical protein